MNANKVSLLRPTDDAIVVRGAGDEYRFLASGSDTGGSYALIEAIVPPGGGPPPHIQTREEEGFYILEGRVTFWSDDDEMDAGPGTFLHVPRGAKHNFQNRTDSPARMLMLFVPGGIAAMFPRMAANPEAYLEIGAEFGVQFPETD